MKREDTDLLTCPGCGFKTIDSGFYGSYDICPICGWEDDGVQLANPCSGGGANKGSLHDVQQDVLKTTPLSTHEAKGFIRDQEWRPLSHEEVASFQEEARKEHWKNHGETDPSKAYWKA